MYCAVTPCTIGVLCSHALYYRCTVQSRHAVFRSWRILAGAMNIMCTVLKDIDIVYTTSGYIYTVSIHCQRGIYYHSLSLPLPLTLLPPPPLSLSTSLLPFSLPPPSLSPPLSLSTSLVPGCQYQGTSVQVAGHKASCSYKDESQLLGITMTEVEQDRQQPMTFLYM